MGKITFSDAMLPDVIQFNEGTAFVGDWARAGYRGYKTWEGDDVDASTQYGDIRFAWTDEIATETAVVADAGILGGMFRFRFVDDLVGMFGGK